MISLHPLSQDFLDVLEEARELHLKKQRDYGKPTDPFANVRGAEEWGIPGWVGAMVRAMDKMRRLQSYTRTGSLENEGVEDSLLDLLVYAGIGLVLFREQEANKK